MIGDKVGKVFYLKNKDTSPNKTSPVFEDEMSDNPLDAIESLGINDAQPQCMDFDGDLDCDCIIAFRDGTIKYYKNVGTATSPNMQDQNTNLGISVPSPPPLPYYKLACKDISVYP